MEKEITYFTLKIKLTETSVSVSTINPEKKEEIVEIKQGIKNYIVNIGFHKNEIQVCQPETTENTLTDFMQELFSRPDQFRKYSFKYQEKEYEVLAETLFTLIIYQFKKVADRRGIMNNFILDVPENTHPEVIHRIKSAIWNINIPNEYTPITREYIHWGC